MTVGSLESKVDKVNKVNGSSGNIERKILQLFAIARFHTPLESNGGSSNTVHLHMNDSGLKKLSQNVPLSKFIAGKIMS